MLAIIFAAQDFIMRKLYVAIIALTLTLPAFSQTTEAINPKKPVEIISRAGDHFMFQLGQNSWNGAPDSVTNRMQSFNRSLSVYLMLNKPFKGDPRFSIGLGVGVGTSNIYFKKTNVDIAGSTPTLGFVNADAIDHFKKYKLATAYAEAPLELRFTAKPSTPNKSMKAAIGVKIGTLINAHTKGKTLQNAGGTTIKEEIVKVNSKSYFNTTRLAATARIGYGIFSLYGSYNLTTMFKDGVAADIKLLQVGLTISGL